MKKSILAICFITSLLTTSCQNKSEDKEIEIQETVNNSEYTDWHSYSNPKETNPEHLSLDIAVDFDKQQISGVAKWKINPEKGVDKVILDTRNMQIDSVLYADGNRANYALGEADEILGAALHVSLLPETKEINVYYKTLEDATALQWLEPSQTFGKKAPFLYTQSESIHVRTWIPSPDSPGARFTYDATVKVPEGLLALMSAENPQEKNENGVYTFQMNEKIPGYLVALAVGDIEFSAVDERTGVYAEPAILEMSAKELDGIGKMVNTAESLYGKYRWGRYDVLMLPSGFPIGGMENPRLTFATPTILAGDKSLTNLIAHELAHSWSGNLVTNATWNDFWLNEGFTTYFEHRIMEAERGEDYAAMLWNLSERTLRGAVEDMGADSPSSQLYVDLKNQDPDLGFTDIPYEKGSAFLMLIEQTVGRKKWDNFLINYFDEHAFQSMTTDYFLDYLDKNLLSENEEWKKTIHIDTWVFGTGIPENYPHLENPLFQAVDKQMEAFIQGGKAADLKTDSWGAQEWMHFVGDLPTNLSIEKMEDLDAVFDLTNSKNSEIADLWYLLALRTNYEVAYPAMKEFLYVTGREKFLDPLYTEMMKTENGKKMAKEIYEIARPNYHPLTQKAMDKIVIE